VQGRDGLERQLEDRKMYFLKKKSRGAATGPDKSQNMVSVEFNVDPEKSGIKDEHQRLAKYLQERYLTVDIYDGDSKFLYGSCKVPLF
jgi:hypothetical protein